MCNKIYCCILRCVVLVFVAFSDWFKIAMVWGQVLRLQLLARGAFPLSKL